MGHLLPHRSNYTDLSYSITEISMYLDVVVLAGIAVVALMIAFFAGFGYFIYRDAQKKPPAD